MNEEYLWDKSGEPDPEIQELEETLGSLRYQPKRLDLPDNNQQTNRRSYVPLVAIAATLVIAVSSRFLLVEPSPQSTSDTNHDDNGSSRTHPYDS